MTATRPRNQIAETSNDDFYAAFDAALNGDDGVDWTPVFSIPDIDDGSTADDLCDPTCDPDAYFVDLTVGSSWIFTTYTAATDADLNSAVQVSINGSERWNSPANATSANQSPGFAGTTVAVIGSISTPVTSTQSSMAMNPSSPPVMVNGGPAPGRVEVIRSHDSGIYELQTQTGVPGDATVTRMQNHIVETSNGDFYAVVNTGLGLVMFESTDDGSHWTIAFAIPDTNRSSSADVQILPGGDTVLMTYLNAQYQVVYQEYAYDATDQTWDRGTYSVVDPTERDSSVHPTVAMNDQGSIFTAYTDETSAGLNMDVQVSFNGGESWNSLVNVTHANGYKGSARVVDMDDDVGVVYTVENTVNYASFTPEGTTNESVYTYGGEQISRYASHFSAVVDGNELIIATNDGDYNLAVLEYNFVTGKWSRPQILTGAGESVTYAQLTLAANGTLYLTYNDDKKNNVLHVGESTDDGASWTPYARLPLPFYAADQPPSRISAPEYCDGSFVVLAQVADPDDSHVQGLLSYVVPISPADPAPDDPPAEGLEAADQLLFREFSEYIGPTDPAVVEYLQDPRIQLVLAVLASPDHFTEQAANSPPADEDLHHAAAGHHWIF